jgi:hypothetical protein
MDELSIPPATAFFNLSMVFTPYNIACNGKVISLDEDYNSEEVEENFDPRLEWDSNQEWEKQKKRLLKGCRHAEQKECNRWAIKMCN